MADDLARLAANANSPSEVLVVKPGMHHGHKHYAAIFWVIAIFAFFGFVYTTLLSFPSNWFNQAAGGVDYPRLYGVSVFVTLIFILFFWILSWAFY